MPEYNGFNLQLVHGRTIVQLRVRPNTAAATRQALQLPQALRWQKGDPATYWLGPEHWLFTSNSQCAEQISQHIDSSLLDQLYATTEMSSGTACFSLTGPAARTALAMGCGIDLHKSTFKIGHCTRTHFANVPLFIVAIEEHSFDLYIDRSLARYLHDWFASASEDPITQTLSIKDSINVSSDFSSNLLSEHSESI